MKIEIALIIILFFPAVVCAQTYYEDVDYETLRAGEINRALALMEAEAEYETYSGTDYATEEAPAIPEVAYTQPAEVYIAAEEAPTPTYIAAEEAPTPTYEYRYAPPPDVELPPQENKFTRELSERIQAIFGDRTYATFGANAGFFRGFTRYHISFDNPDEIGGHGESELVWPLENALMGVTGAIHYRTANSTLEEPRDMIRLGIEWNTRLDKSAGYILDSDWIENDVGFIDWNDNGVLDGSSAWAWNHDGKDIYSESTADLESANIFDVSCVYNFWPTQNWAIGPRIGYRHQKFQFGAYNLHQYGYGPYSDPAFDMSYLDTEGLKWLEYQAKYRIPYLGLSSELIWDRFNVFVNFGYSNWVRIKDQDRHLYPDADEFYGFNIDMVSPGNSRGRAILVGFGAGWKFWPGWEISMGATYLDIATSGTMVQNTYVDGDLWGISDPISQRVTSRYWLTTARLQYIF